MMQAEDLPTRLLRRPRRPLTVSGCAALLVTVAAMGTARADGAATPALRRACATGALTAYACAQHGIGSAAAPAPAAAAPSEAPASPPPSVRVARRVDAPAAVRPFQDTKKRYDLEIPEGWELKMQGGFAAFARGDAWIQLRAAAAPSAQAAAAAGVDLLREQYTGFQTTADAAVTVGGRAGRRMALSARSKAGRPSAIVVVAAPMSPGENLIVIGGGGPEDAATVDAGVSAIARTLRFR